MNYPKGIKSCSSKQINYSNRGMNLEKEINISNEYYCDKGIAFIYKKPTPIKIVKIDYPSKNKAVIKEAFFEMPSTTDYNGIYKGKYVDFEAKETINKSSFPLCNIHKHQIDHIRNIYKNGGICFLIVRFVKLDTTYLLLAKDLIEFIDNFNSKSIPLDYFKDKGHIIVNKYCPRIDYIEIIDKYLEVLKNE